MASLVSYALITAGEHQQALARLCPMMVLVQDVVPMAGDTLLVVFEPGMPAGSDGFNMFCDAIEGVAPGARVRGVDSGLNEQIGTAQQVLKLLQAARDALQAQRPTAPTTEAEVPAYLVALRAWHRAMAPLRSAVRQASDAGPTMMVN